MSARLRLLVFAALLASVFIAATVTDSIPSADRVRDWGDGFGLAGPLLVVPLLAALSCAFVPGPILAGAAGLLFGTALGTAVGLAAATLAACAQLLIARHLVGEQVRAILPAGVARVDAFLERRGFFAVLYVRLAPGIPYVLANYGAGLTRLRLRDMAAGTAVGALPRTFAYAALGGSLDDLGAPEVKIALAMLVVLAIGGAWLARRQIATERRSRPPRAAEAPAPGAT